MQQPNEVIELLSDTDTEAGANSTGNSYHLIIHGKPRSMPRPTFMSWTKKDKLMQRVVNAAKPHLETFRGTVLTMLQQNYSITNGILSLFPTQTVSLQLTFCRHPPNSFFQAKKRNGKDLRKMINEPDKMKPDIDNLAKFVMDALTGIVYTDDSQVTELVLRKLIDNKDPYEGKTIISIKLHT